MTEEFELACTAIQSGDLVVYPTETVYGLGADALDPVAIERVFAAKNRPHSKPISVAVHGLDAVYEYARLTPREEEFIEAFLPGPVTVVVEKDASVPDVLTAGSDRVGIRIPDHELAQRLLERVGPLTATSGNVSGNPSASRVAEIDARIRDHTAVVLDGGETAGGGSTVVDVATETIHRRGARVKRVERWFE